MWAKFVQRIGVAIDPTGSGMTIRCLATVRNTLAISQEQFIPPFGNTISLVGSNISNPWLTYGGPPGFSPAGQNPMGLLAAANTL